MMSQTAPVVETRPRSASTDVKDNAFVAVYNDGDLTDLLFKEPAFATGFLVETEEPHKADGVAISRRKPAAHFNTGTTPPPPAVKATVATQPAKAPMQEATKSSPPPERYERRPSFIEVTLPAEHKENHHPTTKSHPHPHQHRRESSEEHVMDWWPENDSTAQHVWVEKNQTSADEEEDIFEDAVWSETFYD
ncbi:hypothetical protein B0A52_01568 [Exophiala mesophila]|uniref:Uncharacterized protein n=1 Tax=Exophiala mesophila TaxID=212818 RepID=A0A438NFC8_EXOME|nr:hypothetical protein B0A52_01568 [Exophiala mesophila]